MSSGGELGRLERWLALGVVTVGTFMAVLDFSIVNVALPHMMTSFGVNVKQVKWVSTAFLVTTAVGMPMTGWLGHRFGLGRLFLAELIVFTFGSALCAAAWSLEMLVFARVVQALGAGAIMPTSLAVITDTFPVHERGKAIGIWGVGYMVGPSLGPTTGGYLTDWLNWRAIFAINLPIGVIAIAFALLALPAGRSDPGQRFDWAGYLALATCLVAALLTLDNGQDEGWGSAPIVTGGTVAVVSLLVFLALVWQAEHPVVPLRLFGAPDFTLSMLLGLVRASTLFGALFLLPLFLQNVQGRDTIETGLLMVPAAVIVAVCMPLAGMLTDRFGARWPTVAGFLFAAYSLYAWRVLDPLVGRWAVIYPQIWRGLGMALVMAPVNTAAMNAVPRPDAGTASWMLNLTQSMGGAFTIAVAGDADRPRHHRQHGHPGRGRGAAGRHARGAGQRRPAAGLCPIADGTGGHGDRTAQGVAGCVHAGLSGSIRGAGPGHGVGRAARHSAERASPPRSTLASRVPWPKTRPGHRRATRHRQDLPPTGRRWRSRWGAWGACSCWAW